MSTMSAVPSAESIATLLGPSARRPPLTRAREQALAHRIERGDLEAKDALIEAHLRFVVAMVRPYVGHGVPLADLIQEGTIGLIRAAEKFDWRRGLRFSSYAAWWIRQAALHAISETGSLVRLPVARAREADRLERLRAELPGQHGAGPSGADLATAADVPEQRVTQLLSHRDARMVRLDAADDSGRRLVDALADPAAVDATASVVAKEDAEAVHDALDRLPRREAAVLRLRYGLDGEREHSRAEVAEQIHLTRERIRQIEVEANTKLANCPLLDGVGEAA